jgi:hypothetical protein
MKNEFKSSSEKEETLSTFEEEEKREADDPVTKGAVVKVKMLGKDMNVVLCGKGDSFKRGRT